MKSKYINSFDTSSAFETYQSGDVIDYPNIAYIKATGKIVYTTSATPSAPALAFDKSVYNITYWPTEYVIGIGDMPIAFEGYGSTDAFSVTYNGTDVTASAVEDWDSSTNEMVWNENTEGEFYFLTFEPADFPVEPGTYEDVISCGYDNETAIAEVNVTVPDYIVPSDEIGEVTISYPQDDESNCYSVLPTIDFFTANNFGDGGETLDNQDITWTVTRDPESILSVGFDSDNGEWRVYSGASESVSTYYGVLTASYTVGQTTYQTCVLVNDIEVSAAEEEEPEPEEEPGEGE